MSEHISRGARWVGWALVLAAWFIGAYLILEWLGYRSQWMP